MDKLELIKKIQALALNGVGGEALNAQKKLESLMKKYNISKEELNEEVVNEFEIKTKNAFEQDLLNQICFSVYGNIDNSKGLYYYTTSKKIMLVKCTKAEFLEIEAKFDFYKKEYKKQLRLFYKAFIQSNHLFPPTELCKKAEKTSLTDEDLKVLNLAKGIEEAEYLKRLGL